MIMMMPSRPSRPLRRFLTMLLAAIVLATVCFMVDVRIMLHNPLAVALTGKEAASTTPTTAVEDIDPLNHLNLTVATFHPQRREISDKDWNELVCKGNQLRYLMTLPDAAAVDAALGGGGGASQADVPYEKLDGYGWSVKPGAFGYVGSMTKGMHAQLQISRKPEMNWRVKMVQDKAGKVDGHAFKATNAYLYAIYNIHDAIIYIISARSVTSILSNSDLGNHPNDATPLRPLSTLAWIMYLSQVHAWQQTEPAFVPRIRYIMHDSIANRDTLEAMKRACGGVAHPPRWPGKVFEADSEQGRALLATPNGRSAAWLQVQHKAALGHLDLQDIRIFTHKDQGSWNMLLRFAPKDGSDNWAPPA